MKAQSLKAMKVTKILLFDPERKQEGDSLIELRESFQVREFQRQMTEYSTLMGAARQEEAFNLIAPEASKAL